MHGPDTTQLDDRANGGTFRWAEFELDIDEGRDGAEKGSGESQSGGGVAVKDMARYCAGEASAKFHQRPQDISTQPAIQDQGVYSVFGQLPPSGADPTVFICTFTAQGNLVGVDKQ